MTTANKTDAAITAADLRSISGAEIDAPEHFEAECYSGVSIDSRTAVPGDLFFAVKGERHDAHRFLPDVVAKGIRAVVVSREWNAPDEEVWRAVAIVRVPDTTAALGQLARIYRDKFDIPVAAITGTNGKTTTKEMTAVVLSKRFTLLKTEGNLNNQFGLPLTLFRLTPDTELTVIEMGASRPGEIGELCGIARPDAGLITNVGRGHIEFFKSTDEVLNTKAQLLEAVPDADKRLINGDDEKLRELRKRFGGVKSFGTAHDNDFLIENMQLEASGCWSFTFDGSLDITLSVPGKMSVYNAAAAASFGRLFTIEDADIKSALEAFTGYRQRMETLTWNGVFIINDSYNANPDSMRAAFDMLREHPAPGKRFAVLGDMLELGPASRTEHEQTGEAAARSGIGRIITVGSDSKHISDAANYSGFTNAIHAVDHQQAARLLKRELRPGDAVLFKGSRGAAIEKTLELLIKEEQVS